MKNMDKLIENWNIGDIEEKFEIKPGVFKLVTQKGSYILKRKKSEKAILFEYEMLSHLKSKEIPVSVPLRNLSEQPWIKIDNELYSIYPFIEGQALLYDYKKNNTQVITEYGRVLAQLHNALKDYKPSIEIYEMDIIHELFDWAIPTIERNLNKDKLDNFKSTIQGIKTKITSIIGKLPIQLIHRDPHPQNMIFQAGKWKGFIDFDLCCKGHRTFDSSYILTGLLLEGFQSASNRKKWLDLVNPIISGYEEVNKLTIEEKDSIWYIFLSIQLISSAYFFDVNNENLAHQNLDAFYWIYNSFGEIAEMILET